MCNDYFKEQFSKEKIEKNIELYIKYNTASGIDNIKRNTFLENKDCNVDIIERKVNNNTYRFTPYKEKLILKSRESLPRLISIPTLRDRIVLKSLQLILKDIYDDINLKLPQICIQELKDNIEKFDYFIKLDVSKFYDNICHGILLNKIKQRIKDDNLINIILKAIQTPTISEGMKIKGIGKSMKGVPQGLPISNILASIYLNDLDNKYKNNSKIKYIRYVDDILILCNKRDSDSIYNEISYDIQGILGLTLNTKKTIKNKIEGNTIEFLGYKYGKLRNKKTNLSVKDSNVLKFENSIIAIFYKYKNDDKISSKQFIFTLNNKITGSITKKFSSDGEREYKYGWLFYFSQIEDLPLLYHLDYFIDDLLKRFDRCKCIERDSIKYFVKAFFEIRYNIKETTYIHKPDILTNEERADLLRETFNIKNIQKGNIDKVYFKYVYNPIRFEQKDIQKIIS